MSKRDIVDRLSEVAKDFELREHFIGVVEDARNEIVRLRMALKPFADKWDEILLWKDTAGIVDPPEERHCEAAWKALHE